MECPSAPREVNVQAVEIAEVDLAPPMIVRDFGQALFNLPNAMIERYSVEVNPSTVCNSHTAEQFLADTFVACSAVRH
jgi:hypothetical protein